MNAGRSFVLNTGARIPALGLGTWQAAPGEVGRAVKAALDVGYRHLDLAYVYENEKEIGVALKEWFQANPQVHRRDIWITSKLWNTFHRPEDVARGLDITLSDLGIDYLDLYLMHWPIAFPHQGDKNLAPKGPDGNVLDITSTVPLSATWKAMEKLVGTGKVKAIGVSNFSISTLENLLKSATIVPAVNQVELHPYLPQPKLLEYCAQHKIHVTAYSPLGSTATRPNLREDPEIAKIAAKHGKTPAQVLISWAIQRGCSVIPKSVHPDRVKSNFEVFDLTEEDMRQIEPLAQVNARVCDCKVFWKIDVFDEAHPRL